MNRVLSLQPMNPPKCVLTFFFHLTEGCSEGLGEFRFFFKQLLPLVGVEERHENAPSVFLNKQHPSIELL